MDTIHGTKPTGPNRTARWAHETVNDTNIVLVRYEGWLIVDTVTTGDPEIAALVVNHWRASGYIA